MKKNKLLVLFLGTISLPAFASLFDHQTEFPQHLYINQDQVAANKKSSESCFESSTCKSHYNPTQGLYTLEKHSGKYFSKTQYQLNKTEGGGFSVTKSFCKSKKSNCVPDTISQVPCTQSQASTNKSLVDSNTGASISTSSEPMYWIDDKENGTFSCFYSNKNTAQKISAAKPAKENIKTRLGATSGSSSSSKNMYFQGALCTTWSDAINQQRNNPSGEGQYVSFQLHNDGTVGVYLTTSGCLVEPCRYHKPRLQIQSQPCLIVNNKGDFLQNMSSELSYEKNCHSGAISSDTINNSDIILNISFNTDFSDMTFAPTPGCVMYMASPPNPVNTPANVYFSNVNGSSQCPSSQVYLSQASGWSNSTGGTLTLITIPNNYMRSTDEISFSYSNNNWYLNGMPCQNTTSGINTQYCGSSNTNPFSYGQNNFLFELSSDNRSVINCAVVNPTIPQPKTHFNGDTGPYYFGSTTKNTCMIMTYSDKQVGLTCQGPSGWNVTDKIAISTNPENNLPILQIGTNKTTCTPTSDITAQNILLGSSPWNNIPGSVYAQITNSNGNINLTCNTLTAKKPTNFNGNTAPYYFGGATSSCLITSDMNNAVGLACQGNYGWNATNTIKIGTKNGVATMQLGNNAAVSCSPSTDVTTDGTLPGSSTWNNAPGSVYAQVTNSNGNINLTCSTLTAKKPTNFSGNTAPYYFGGATGSCLITSNANNKIGLACQSNNGWNATDTITIGTKNGVATMQLGNNTAVSCSPSTDVTTNGTLPGSSTWNNAPGSVYAQITNSNGNINLTCSTLTAKKPTNFSGNTAPYYFGGATSSCLITSDSNNTVGLTCQGNYGWNTKSTITIGTNKQGLTTMQLGNNAPVSCTPSTNVKTNGTLPGSSTWNNAPGSVYAQITNSNGNISLQCNTEIPPKTNLCFTKTSYSNKNGQPLPTQCQQFYPTACTNLKWSTSNCNTGPSTKLIRGSCGIIRNLLITVKTQTMGISIANPYAPATTIAPKLTAAGCLVNPNSIPPYSP